MSLKPLLVCLLCAASLVCAHPHVFVDAKIKVMFDNAGFSAVKNHWVYDEIYSSAMMSSGDADGDGKISESENKWFLETILGPLKEFNYYNYVQSGSIFLKAQGLSNFKASFKNLPRLVKFYHAIKRECRVRDAGYTYRNYGGRNVVITPAKIKKAIEIIFGENSQEILFGKEKNNGKS
jgi:ABC-type uncharacterized transport system substrate-binding protein